MVNASIDSETSTVSDLLSMDILEQQVYPEEL